MGKNHRAIGVIDAETDPFKRYRVPRPFIWGFYDGSRYLSFERTGDLVEFLKDFDGIVYAHNGGRFDFHFLLHYLEPYSDIMLIHGRIASVKLGACELRDSYCILPIPLKAYKKDEIDYSIMEIEARYLKRNWDAINQYLKSDCVYLWELVTRFIEDYGLSLTLAGAAMKQWKKISPLEVPRSDHVFYGDIFPYYYGGRVQCFETGVIDQPFRVFDINSAYPFAMLHKHPYSLNYHERGHWHDKCDFVRFKGVSLGALPYRSKGDDGHVKNTLLFPDDHEPREYFVTRWEFDAAIDTLLLYDVEIISTLTFMGHVDFSDYVNHFHRVKQEAEKTGDVATRTFAKLFLNSLYGKFAANPDKYRDRMIVPPEVAPGLCTDDALEKIGWKAGGEIGPWILAEAELDDHKKHYYNVATGASITGFVRAMLWRSLCASGRPLYCDTDSIAAFSDGGDLRGDGDGKKLGEWKLEGNFYRAGIAGKKLYIFDGSDPDGNPLTKMATKGARLSEAQMWEVAEGGDVDYQPDAPTFSAKANPWMIAVENEEIGKKMFMTRKIKNTLQNT